MTMTKNNDNDIATLLTGLFSGIDDENKALAASLTDCELIKKAIECIKEDNPEHFHLFMTYPIERFVDGMLSREMPQSRDGQFLFKEAGFIESHFEKLIDKHEGGACCADKSRSIMRALARYFLKGQPIAFDYTQEYTYHLPKLIFKTHDDIVGFFEALKHLYFGSPDLYLNALQKIYADIRQEKSEHNTGIANAAH